MKVRSQLAIIGGLVALASAHGDEHGGHGEANPNANYAERHVGRNPNFAIPTVHDSYLLLLRIDAFNPSTFFQLHDLDRNGILDRGEIEAIYGVHHVYSKRKSPSEEAQAAKAVLVADAVLAAFDTNKDGFVTMEEFLAKGLDGLPDFSSLGAEGHHYDVESEFFLHHEELYHNTPETQTDESYNHPEDMWVQALITKEQATHSYIFLPSEHFAHHEEIERLETERERKYEGLAADGIHAAEPDKKAGSEPEFKPSPKYTYTRAPKDGQIIGQIPGQIDDLKREAAGKDAWGTGSGGYKPPKEAVDRMRKNVPYKPSRMQYKFKRNWAWCCVPLWLTSLELSTGIGQERARTNPVLLGTVMHTRYLIVINPPILPHLPVVIIMSSTPDQFKRKIILHAQASR
ncbi:hypothetical protein FRC10_005020 [Ceratobasidium sp. 414]|nr:hypothetical protein FRC10_005020 [Ceratobasidium sp. 414]